MTDNKDIQKKYLVGFYYPRNIKKNELFFLP